MSIKVIMLTYLEVVAPPINKGIFIANLSISLATKIISSRDGVISPDRPIISIVKKEEELTSDNEKKRKEDHFLKILD